MAFAFDNESITEWSPAWADSTPPRTSHVRIGVLYRGLSVAAIRCLFNEGAVPVFAMATIGPRLFFGRTNGPFIPYDSKARDHNLDCPVSERSWPWNLGDEVWLVLFWRGYPVVAWCSGENECSFIALRSGTTAPETVANLQALASVASDGYAVEIPNARVPPRD